MTLLVLGLLLFLGVHSIRIVADGARTQLISRLGTGGFKALYGLVSVVGLVLIVVGFGEARQSPVLLYAPPLGLRHANALFTLLAFVLVAAAYVPRNHLKAWLGHPMLAGVKLWAFGHLLATGFLHDVVLFGAFLLWAVVDFAVSRRRDRRKGVHSAPGQWPSDVVVVLIGVAAWVAFAFWLHQRWIGVSPFA
jgi:uncharacterized membrane protein